MKFVKASERLPDDWKKAYYYIAEDDSRHYASVLIDKDGHWRNYNGWKVTEWLDESEGTIGDVELPFIPGKKYSWAGHFHSTNKHFPHLGTGYSFVDCGKANTYFEKDNRELLEKLFYTVDETMICPMTNKHCDDECCPVGSECNLKPDNKISCPEENETKTEKFLGLYIGQLIYDIDADKTYSFNGKDWIKVRNISKK